MQTETLQERYKVVSPAEKGVITRILKERNGIFQHTSPAQRRALLLGQCKFFLTGIQGQASTLRTLIKSSTNSTDLHLGDCLALHANMDALLRDVQYALREVQTISHFHSQPKPGKNDNDIS